MKFLQSFVVALCLFISVATFAAQESGQKISPIIFLPVELAESGAYKKVKATTERVMGIIVNAQGYVEKDPERFYKAVEVVLGDIVDFDSFARGVMGKYGSSQFYRGLKTPAEKDKFKKQLKRFSSVFKHGLVQTYAMGLLAFEGDKIEILAPAKGVQRENAVTVIQHIYGKADKPYVVHYKMRRDRSNEWKLRNVTIEAINLGKVYQSQFYSAVKQYNGDIDRVIDNWTVAPATDQTKAG